VLLDVTPLTLGVETLGGIRTPIVNRNTTIPTSGNQIFSTAADNQTSVEINVLQGEREMATDNKSLGRFILDGIPPAPRGVPQVEVKFDIDSSGILKVSAKDKTSGKEANITIANSTNLSDEEVEKMRKDAEAHAEEDKTKKELIEAKNHANSVAFEMEKQLKDYGSALESDDDRKKIADNIEALKKLTTDDSASKDDLDKAIEETLQSAQKLGEALGKKQAAEAQGKANNEEKSDKKKKPKEDKNEEEVVEGEVVS
jgi:molecular chaperone DnaK